MGSTSGSRTIFTTVCATRSAMVGIPKGRIPPLAFGISTRRTGGAKYDPDDIRFQILKRFLFRSFSKAAMGDGIHARRPTIFFHLFPGVPNEAFGNVIWLRLRHRLLPSPVGRFL